MRAWYVVEPTTDAVSPPAAHVHRAAALGCTLVVGDPTGVVVVFPTAVVVSSVVPPAVYPDTAGQATPAEVASAKEAAAAAEATRQTKIAAALSSLKAAVTDLAPGLTEGAADLATLAARPSTTALAAILHRVVTREMVIAQGIADLLVVLELVEPTAVGS